MSVNPRTRSQFFTLATDRLLLRVRLYGQFEDLSLRFYCIQSASRQDTSIAIPRQKKENLNAD